MAEWYAAGVPVIEIAERLGRSCDAVSVRRRTLGLESRRRPLAAAVDSAIAAAASEREPVPVTAARLGLTVAQVRWQRRALLAPPARPVRRYTTAEDARIREAFGAGSDLTSLAAALGRSPDAIRLRAERLGLYTPARRTRWTATEDDAIRDGYTGSLSCEEIADQLPGRTGETVAARAAKLGLIRHARRWSKTDDRALRWIADRRIDLVEAGRRLHRTPEAVARRAHRLGITVPARAAQRTGPWTREEDHILRAWKDSTPTSLARVLNRSDQSVRRRLRQLGLPLHGERTPHHTRSARA